MALLIIGLAVFLGVHSIAIVSPELRDRALQGLGEGAWKGVYGLISLIGCVLFVGWAHGRLFGVSPLG